MADPTPKRLTIPVTGTYLFGYPCACGKPLLLKTGNNHYTCQTCQRVQNIPALKAATTP